MDMDIVKAMVSKDISEVRRNKMILYPLIVMPVIFAIVVPAASIMSLQDSSLSAKEHTVLLSIITGGLIPLFILIPAAISNIISAYSFVGEKTEKTLEPLLATPATDSELLMGKMLSALLPALAATIIAFIMLILVVDFISYPILGYLLLPNVTWILAIFLLSPLIGLLSIIVSIIFSARMSDPRAVQQMSVLVMLPFIALFIGSVNQLITVSDVLMLALIGAVAIADWFLFSLAKKLFERESILTKWK